MAGLGPRETWSCRRRGPRAGAVASRRCQHRHRIVEWSELRRQEPASAICMAAELRWHHRKLPRRARREEPGAVAPSKRVSGFCPDCRRGNSGPSYRARPDGKLAVVEAATVISSGRPAQGPPWLKDRPSWSPFVSSPGIFQNLLRRAVEGFPASRSCGWRSGALPAPGIYPALS